MSPQIYPLKEIDHSSPAIHFFHQMTYWMGRLITACVQISNNLYQLLTKVKNIATPAIQSPSKSPVAIPQKTPLSTPIHSPLKKNPNPSPLATSFSKEDELQLDLMIDSFDEEKPARSQKRLSLQLNPGAATHDRIFENFLKSIGFKDISSFLQKGVFSDLDGKSIDSADVENLTGEYLVEWNIDKDESIHISEPIKLSFQGNFKNGAFHGKGFLAKVNEMGSIFPILNGLFEDDAFISGLAVSADDYIEGTFKKGCKTGEGTIRYFKTNDPHDPLASHIEYHGQFSEGTFNGNGKAFIINLHGIRLLAEGFFKNGNLIKGCYHEDDGRIYQGEWTVNTDGTHSFKGCLINRKEHSSYDGEIVNARFHGQGKYTLRQFCDYDDLCFENGSILKTHKNTFIDYTCIGVFKNGKLWDGEQTIQWQDGKHGIQICENGVIVMTTITTPDGFKFQGTFEPYVLTGHGKVYAPDGLEIYSGGLECGIPHGYGIMKRDGKVYKGEFQWGQLVFD